MTKYMDEIIPILFTPPKAWIPSYITTFQSSPVRIYGAIWQDFFYYKFIKFWVLLLSCSPLDPKTNSETPNFIKKVVKFGFVVSNPNFHEFFDQLLIKLNLFIFICFFSSETIWFENSGKYKIRTYRISCRIQWER